MKPKYRTRVNKTAQDIKGSKSKVVRIELNNYVKPQSQISYQIQNQMVFNGDDNKYFDFLKDRYIGSVTNASIINDISDYIYGLGLTNNGKSIKDIISNEDLRSIIKDYKMYAHSAMEVIYNSNRKVTNIYHISIKSIAIQAPVDYNEAPEEFHYCFDWTEKSKFPPQRFPAFGIYNSLTEEEIKAIELESGEPLEAPASEILVIGLSKRFPYFKLPDYQAALQYCQSEEEISNFTLSWIENGFSAGYIVNVNKGLEDTEEGQAEAEKAIKQGLTGSSNGGKFFLSFNDNPEMKTTIEAIQSTDEHNKYMETAKEAREKIIASHRYFPILMGVDTNSGFGNNADEMNTALRVFYRKVVNPMREVLIDSLESIFKINDENTNLDFIDFKDIAIKETEVVEPTNNTNE
jgi:capsid portal protein